MSPAQIVRTVHTRARQNWLIVAYVLATIAVTMLAVVVEAAR